MSYVLEAGQLTVAKKNYTYTRLAQATTHQIKWEQLAVSDSEDDLKEYAKSIDWPQHSVSLRIVGIAEHAGLLMEI